jgi:hypothetical protein
MTRRLALALLSTLALTGLFAGPAQAEVRTSSGLWDARYCELFELEGALPDATVTIWNTIGLNDCPAEWWNDLDTAALAAQRGATAVIRNGPRHWVIDAAKGDVGGVETFAGERLRHVGMIPLDSAADLQQAPYSERTIERRNTWFWKKGRRVYELVDPKGVRYRMQSYSQIVDPGLRMRDLQSLGERLELPDGWRFKSYRLRRELKMKAPGTATIIQDDLRNTYQRVVPEPTGKRRVVDVEGMTKLVGFSSPGVLNDQGTITGRPFGEGTVDIHVRLGAGGTATADFTFETDRGTASAHADLTFEISGGEIHFVGTADFVSGTGRYRRITGTDLQVTDDNTLDGQNGRITLNGFARF